MLGGWSRGGRCRRVPREWQVSAGGAGCCAGKVIQHFSAQDRQLLGNEGPTAAWSGIQLAAAVCSPRVKELQKPCDFSLQKRLDVGRLRPILSQKLCLNHVPLLPV